MRVDWRTRLKETVRRYGCAMLVLVVGICLMLLPGGGDGKDKESSSGFQTEEDSFDLEAFEARMEQVLSTVDGAGPVKVVLTIAGGSRQILAQDRDQDGDGGSSSSTVTLGRGSGSQTVVPLQTLAPSFRGALVVCPGGGDPQVKLLLTQAVSGLTGLGADRITICPGNPDNE